MSCNCVVERALGKILFVVFTPPLLLGRLILGKLLHWGFLPWLRGEQSAGNTWRSPGGGHGSPSQYSCLANPMDRGAWRAEVHGVAQNRTRLKWFSMHACIGEGNGNPHQCSCLENPRDGGAWWAALYGSHRVGHEWSDLAAAVYKNLFVLSSSYNYCFWYHILYLIVLYIP